MTRRAKIVCTLGPATNNDAMVRALVEAGMDVARMNFSHGDYADHEESYQRIRRASDESGRAVGILADLQGPKIRLGRFKDGPTVWANGETVTITVDDCEGTHDRVSTTYKNLAKDAKPGDRMLVDDGKVAVVVEHIDGNDVVCTVTEGGPVSNNKGLSMPGMAFSVPAMSEKDIADLEFALKLGVDLVALSFVRSPSDAHLVHEVMDRVGRRVPVIAKLEKPEAVENLEAIVMAFDAIMVARGDLGVEIDVARMPVVQKEIIAMCRRYQKPVIVATQMLDSMQKSPRPTRAEVTDIANAILDGADACMLSGETAVGDYPTVAVEMMNRVAMATEPLFANRTELAVAEVSPEGLERITQGVVLGAAVTAKALQAKMMIVVSNSGVTALALSKYRNLLPIIGVTTKPSTLNQMCLYWGVIPLADAPTTDSFELINHVQQWGLANGSLQMGDDIVLVAGIGLASKGHNMVRVHTVGQSVT